MGHSKHALSVEVEAEAWECIQQWTALASGEFSCLANVNDDLYVSEVHLLEQECTDSSTELEPDAIAQLLAEVDDTENIRCWIHSHGTYPVMWSATDEACIEGLANESFLVSIVVNKRGDSLCRVDLFQPFRLTVHQVPIRVRVKSPQLQRRCQGEFDRKVREVPIQFSLTPTGRQALKWSHPRGAR